jgi:hypothetical protein
MMSEIAGEDSDVDWVLTFVWLLLPSVVVGALLAWAEHIRRTGGRRRWRWLALSPLVFAGVLLSQPTDPARLLEDGVGGAAPSPSRSSAWQVGMRSPAAERAGPGWSRACSH